MIGWNFRMTDIQAAIGIVQLKRIDEILSKRRYVALMYTQELADLYLTGVIHGQSIPRDIEYSPFVFTIEVDNRDKVMRYLLANGIECKPYFPCIHLQKPYRDMGYNEGMFPVAEEVSRRTLALPFYSDMTEQEVDTVCQTLKQLLN